MDIVSVVSKIVAPLKMRIMLMISRAVVALVKDSSGIQTVQVTGLSGEVLSAIERFQQFGFTAVPLPGAEAVICSIGGDRANCVVLAIEDRNRRKKGLQPGESAMYDALGNFIHLKADQIHVKHSAKVVVDSPVVEVGNVALEKAIAGETFMSFFNSHTHVGNFGAPTSPPSSPMTPLQLSQTVKVSK
jgi:phage baseplate assembly protein V